MRFTVGVFCSQQVKKMRKTSEEFHNSLSGFDKRGNEEEKWKWMKRFSIEIVRVGSVDWSAVK